MAKWQRPEMTPWTIGEPRDDGGFLPVADATGPAGEKHLLRVISTPASAEDGEMPLWEVRDICPNRPCNGQAYVIPA